MSSRLSYCRPHRYHSKYHTTANHAIFLDKRVISFFCLQIWDSFPKTLPMEKLVSRSRDTLDPCPLADSPQLMQAKTQGLEGRVPDCQVWSCGSVCRQVKRHMNILPSSVSTVCVQLSYYVSWDYFLVPVKSRKLHS